MTSKPPKPRANAGWRTAALLAAFVLSAAGIAYWITQRDPMSGAAETNLGNTAPREGPLRVVRDCDVCPELVIVPKGRFVMGSTTGNFNEQPTRTIRVPSFAIGRFEVTQREWVAILGHNPSAFQDCGPDCPVDSAREINEFFEKLFQLTGHHYRRPSAAEWEYAARAGSTTRWSHGDEPAQLGLYAWYVGNAGERPHPVGQKRPNAWGLYDMFGNVWEYVDACEGIGSARDDLNGGDSKALISCITTEFRGGSWLDGPRDLRSATREWPEPYFGETRGLRVARSLWPEDVAPKP